MRVHGRVKDKGPTAQKKNIRKVERKISVKVWQKRWDRSSKGRWTHRLQHRKVDSQVAYATDVPFNAIFDGPRMFPQLFSPHEQDVRQRLHILFMGR